MINNFPGRQGARFFLFTVFLGLVAVNSVIGKTTAVHPHLVDGLLSLAMGTALFGADISGSCKTLRRQAGTKKLSIIATGVLIAEA
jgi:hypothetical protein